MTNHHADHPDATPAPQDDFWGEQAEWAPSDRRPPGQRTGLGAAIGRWWGGILGSGSGAERVHGQTAGGRVHDAGDDLGHDVAHDAGAVGRPPQELADDEFGDDAIGDDAIDDELGAGDWTFEPEPRSSRGPGVDPLLARFGGLAVILTLAVPLVMGFASGADDDSVDDGSPTAIAGVASDPLPETASPAPTAAAAAATTPAAAPTSSAAAPTSSAASVEVAEPVDEPAAVALEAPDTTPVVTAAPCGNEYELVAGDYWIRIADAADVALADLLDVNDASVDTVLVPGRSICLPVGASTPAPPPVAATTTDAPTTVAAVPSRPSTTTPVTTSPPAPTTAAPAPTTAAPAPTTAAPALPPVVSGSAAVAIIREVWPDDLEERAIAIAWRESNHRSDVSNSCCYGLFQIHWTAHRSWLGSLGVTSATQLYDARVNTVAAYTLYQRSGGFGPWGG